MERTTTSKVLSLLLTFALYIGAFAGVSIAMEAAAPMPFAAATPSHTTIETASSLPNGTVGTAYAQTLALTASSTPAPYEWFVISGSLPSGLQLSSSGLTGRISGTPTVPGTFHFTVRAVADNMGIYMDEKAFSITINPSGSFGSSSTSSSSSSGGGSSDPAQPASQPLSQSNAISEIRSQINAQAGDSTVVTFRNIGTVPASTFEAMANAAGNSGLEVRFDSMDGSAVDVRLYIDPSTVSGDLNVSASTNNQAAQSTKNKFEKFFDNDIAVVSFGQQGSFGTAINVAARVDLSGIDTETLVFYSYDREINQFRLIENPGYRIDANGYLRFTTELAGSIVISDAPLQKK